jgi:hypothetical protein
MTTAIFTGSRLIAPFRIGSPEPTQHGGFVRLLF